MRVSDPMRVLALLKRHGWNSTSFQVLEPGYRYWFDGPDACVAYVETARAWVTAGAPIAAPERLADVLARFTEAARGAGKRVCCFATETRFLDAVGWPALRIGEQPTWRPAQWRAVVGSRRGLRTQLRRARAKGVTIRPLAPGELRDLRSATRAAVDQLGGRWLASHPLAPMGFLVRPDLDAFPEERLCFVAEQGARLVGFLGAVPIYARGGWLLEDLWREPDAPNGMAELLIDAAMCAAADRRAPYATLGLVPLAGALPLWLRLARSCGRPLYDFEGLRAFRARLGPARWDPIYLAHPPRSARCLALFDALEAFAEGGLLRFGVRTLLRRCSRPADPLRRPRPR